MDKLPLQKQLSNLLADKKSFFHEGHYAEKFQDLFEVGETDLSLAKLAEAHWDALSILRESKKMPAPKAIYGVWASEIPGKKLKLKTLDEDTFILSGPKMFCSGANTVTRALITADYLLLDLDVDKNRHLLDISTKSWATSAFKDTTTATILFKEVPFKKADIVGTTEWYIERQGFWPGSIAPAACWAGGASGLVNFALQQSRKDPHTLAHLGAMSANIWAMRAILNSAATELEERLQSPSTQILALKVRHLIEQLSSDILRRFARAYGPFPLACHEKISRRYQELDLFLRQNHAERDLGRLGDLLKKIPNAPIK